MNITRNLIVAALMTLVTTVILGVIYPLAVTGIAQALFPDKANGQLIELNGTVIGSRIIGQAFSSPGYFRPRPSATGHAVRCRQLRRQPVRSDEQEAHRCRDGQCGSRPQGESRRPDTGGSRHDLGVRVRSPSLAGGSGVPGTACGAGARHVERRCSAPGRRAHRGTSAWVFWRAAGERSGAQSRARPGASDREVGVVERAGTALRFPKYDEPPRVVLGTVDESIVSVDWPEIPARQCRVRRRRQSPDARVRPLDETPPSAVIRDRQQPAGHRSAST